VETAVLALLVIVFTAIALFTALACGGWARAMAHQAQLSQEASWHQVPALVLTGQHRPAGQPGAGQAPDGRLGRGVAGYRAALDNPGLTRMWRKTAK
jgi:hypothetical protein